MCAETEIRVTSEVREALAERDIDVDVGDEFSIICFGPDPYRPDNPCVVDPDANSFGT